MENIDKLKKISNKIPIILLTGLDDIEIGRKAVVKGAQDFLTKGNVNTDALCKSINYSIERKQIELKLNGLNETLKHTIQYDSLTGVINRRPFINLLENNIARAERNQEQIAILYIDIEDFKQINDTFGHHIGDRVLQITAQRLKECSRKSDFVGRLGGDEFIICLNNIKSITDAAKVAHKINNLFTNPIILDGVIINIGVSIGIAIYPNDGDNASILLNNSDIAMYKSKKMRKNSFHIFNTQLKIEQEYKYQLSNALSRNEYKVNYQGIFNKKMQLVFIEALLKWDIPKYRNKSSMDFIPILEENKSIIKVGKWILTEVSRDLKYLSDKIDSNNIPVSINLSQQQIEDKDFLKNINNILEKYNLSPNNLIIYFTRLIS